MLTSATEQLVLLFRVPRLYASGNFDDINSNGKISLLCIVFSCWYHQYPHHPHPSTLMISEEIPKSKSTKLQ